MLAGIKDILIVVNKGQVAQFRKILSNGKRFGVSISYVEQHKPRGLPDAFIIGEKFIGKENIALILGDNFLWTKFNVKIKELCKIKFWMQNFITSCQ